MPWFYIFKGDGNPVFSPEFRRGGLAALFGCIIWQVLSSPTLTITVQGRNEADTAWTDIDVFSSITAIGRPTADIGSLLEILRFKYTVAGGSATSGVAISMLTPQWRDS